jgi:hypothetical protein
VFTVVITLLPNVLNEKDYPEYAKGQHTSHVSRNAQDDISRYTGVEYDKNPQNVKFDDNARAKLTSLLENPTSENRVALIKSLTDAETAGVLPQGSAQKFFETGDSTVIKQMVQDSSKLTEATGKRLIKGGAKVGVGAAVGGGLAGNTGAAVGAGVGALSEMYGSKLQEMIALAKAAEDSKLMKLGRYLPGTLGTIGALAGGAAAANAGDLTPAEASLATAAEIANPLPMTDVIQGSIDAKKAANEAQSQLGDRDVTFEAEMAQYGDLGANPAQTILTANPVEAARQKGFLKGFVSPFPVVGKMVGEGVEQLTDSFGKEQSNDARSRMEQNMKAFDQLKNDKNEVLKSGEALKQATPEQLMELSQSFKEIKGADNFVAPLENAAQASTEEEKKARLFGLYQQPAFRQLINRGKGKKE